MSLTMESKEYCKLCLATDVRMFSLSIPCIGEAYLQLLQTSSLPVNGFTCYECASRLKKYKEFHSKCSNAQVLLTYLNHDHSVITKQMVQLVDRKLHNLETSLERSKVEEFSFHLSDSFSNSDSEVKIFHYEIKVEGNGDDTCDNIFEPCLETIVIEESNHSSTKNTKKRKKASPYKSKQKKRKKSEEITIKDENDFEGNGCVSDVDDVPLSEILKAEDEKSDKIEESTKLVHKKGTKGIISEGVKKCGGIKKNDGIKKSPGWKFNMDFFKDYATVITMTKEEAKKEMLLRKESSNYKNCMYKCELCFRGYDTQVTFENHMKKHSVGYGPFECDICHVRFATKFIVWQHYTMCHKRKYLCKLCSYTCFCTQQARSHVNRHKGKKFTCKDCGEVFSMPNSLLMHQRNKHKAEIVCDICGSVFIVERGLKSHKRLLHTQEKNEGKGPKCEECGVQFSTETAWKRHLVLSTKHKVSNGCETCGETFADAKSLRKHSKTHGKVYKPSDRIRASTASVDLPASCSLCDLWITTRSMYRAHMTSQHPEAEDTKQNDVDATKECMCEVCGKVFKKQCFLEYHKRTHTGERPFQCGECGRSYTTSGALKTHRASHLNGPPPAHSCHLCDKVLQSRSALNKHVKVAHLNIRPHKCAICEKMFPNPCEVRSHMKHVHFKVPWPKRDRSKRPKETTA